MKICSNQVIFYIVVSYNIISSHCHNEWCFPNISPNSIADEEDTSKISIYPRQSHNALLLGMSHYENVTHRISIVSLEHEVLILDLENNIDLIFFVLFHI
jgi:hypothetical protein